MTSTPGIDRRRFLAAALATAAWAQPKKTLTPLELKHRLRGPILAAPAVYTAELAVDHESVARMVDVAAKTGVKVFALAQGISSYDRLSYEEIKALTRTVGEAVAGRGAFIAATGAWETTQALDYARFSRSVGADAVQVMAPPKAADAVWLSHFTALAKAVPLALVLDGQPPLALLRKLATIDALVAIKEEFPADYTMPIYEEFGDRFNLFAGGTKARFLAYRLYGMQAYYSVFASFAPQIAVDFWRAVENNDLTAARRVVLGYDVPFFRRFSQAFWHGTLEHFGVAGRRVRPKEETLSDPQMAQLAAFYRKLGMTQTAAPAEAIIPARPGPKVP